MQGSTRIALRKGKGTTILRSVCILTISALLCISAIFAQQDSLHFDRETLGRPFTLEEILQTEGFGSNSQFTGGAPKWVTEGELTTDTVYYGIGKSSQSQDAADDDARLRFAQHVEVHVQSIAIQKIEENRERLEENYSFESLVSTNLNLRGVKITERYMDSDSTFHSLIRYGKAAYHSMVTHELEVKLESDIRQQQLAFKAREALLADSLRHKMRMDSLALARKQAVIDSLDQILAMEQRKQQQAEERIDLIKNRYSAFLKIKPHYLLIDVPSSTTPNSWFNLSGRWNPENSQMRELRAGLSAWLFSIESSLMSESNIVNQGELSLKLEVLPTVGEIYPVSLALGWTQYLESFAAENQIDLDGTEMFSDMISKINDEVSSPHAPGSSFFAVATGGVPTLRSHFSLYLDNRKVSLGSTWYPFPRHLRDSISLINQIDVIRNDAFRNRFDDALQWQFGLRFIAIKDRFATMIAYEDHEYWRLNFEFQY